MSIGITDELAPLGSFPVLEDINLKGGYQVVADVTARNAIPLSNRKIGMQVYTVATGQLWLLYPNITDAYWSVVIAGVALASGAPADVTKATAVVGTSSEAARSDHKHDISTAAPVNVTKATNAEGTATSLSRSDHKHDVSTAAPTTGIGAANSEGTATTLARSDHSHALRTTTGPTDLAIGAIADGEFLKRVGTSIVSAALSVAVAKLYPVALNANTTLLTTEVVVGGIYFDPALFTSPTVSLRIVGNFTATTGTSTARLYLYDMGPGTGAFSPLRRSTVTIPFANVGQQVKVDQALTLSASPGVDADQIHTTARVYELRMYLNTADVGATMAVAWGGLAVV